jgi:anti-sigma regulatory factor (Ser/Thr protein kinase)
MRRGFGYTRPMTSREPAAPGPERPSGTDVPEVFAVDETFDADRLYALRATLSAHMSGFGTPAVLIDRLLIVASELATNAVRHGGGHGRLRLWPADGGLFCEVIDDGPGFADPGVGDSAPGPTATGGRGMWICRQLSDELVIRTRPHGTTVTAFLGPLSGDRRAI